MPPTFTGPNIFLRIFLSNTNLDSIFLVKAHIFYPYIKTGLIMMLYTSSFELVNNNLVFNILSNPYLNLFVIFILTLLYLLPCYCYWFRSKVFKAPHSIKLSSIFMKFCGSAVLDDTKYCVLSLFT